jgi:hypothetical protein
MLKEISHKIRKSIRLADIRYFNGASLGSTIISESKSIMTFIHFNLQCTTDNLSLIINNNGIQKSISTLVYYSWAARSNPAKYFSVVVAKEWRPT